MARKKTDEEKQQDAQRKAEAKRLKAEADLTVKILANLGKFIDDTERPLQGTARNPGFFGGGAPAAKLVQEAVNRGLLQPSAADPKRGRLTDKGRQFVLDNVGPKKAVEAFLEEVRRQAATVRPLDPDALRQQLELLVEQARQTSQATVQRLEQLTQATAAVKQLLERQEPAPAQPQAAPGVANWLDDVVRFVAEQKQQNAFKRLALPEIFARLRGTHPDLTLGEFHDGLRSLHDRKRISLWPYTQTLGSLDDPRAALYLDREVKYYADLP